MACGRYRGRRGGRRDVGSDVLGVRRPVVWSFSVDDFDSSWFSGATSCFVLLPRHAGLSDRAQAGSFGLRAFGRIVRRGGTRHEIQCKPGGNRIAAGSSRRSGIRTVPLPSLDARRHHSGLLWRLESSTTSTCCSSTIRHSHSSAREASSALFASCLARWHSPVSVPGECIALYVSQVFCRDSLPRIRNITKKTPESTFESMPRPF